MITNTDKTVALWYFLNERGIDLRAGGGYYPGHIPSSEVQSLVDNYTIEQARTWWSTQVDLLAKSKRDIVVSGHSAGEMAAWPLKEAEAKAYVDEATAEALCPLLYKEASDGGVTTESVKQRVLANSVAFRAVEGAIAGRVRALKEQIKVAGFSDMPDITTGWPV